MFFGSLDGDLGGVCTFVSLSVSLESPFPTGGLVGAGEIGESLDPGPSVSSRMRRLALCFLGALGRVLVTCSNLGPVGSSLAALKSTEKGKNPENL